MYLIADNEAPRFDLPGVEFTGLAAPSRGATAVCTWRITVAAGHRSEQPHTLDQEEIFMVTAGAIQLADDGVPVSAGGVAIVPAGARIQLINPGTEPAEAYVAIRTGFTATLSDGTTLGTPPWAR